VFPERRYFETVNQVENYGIISKNCILTAMSLGPEIADTSMVS
jgi:hypothetical protein